MSVPAPTNSLTNKVPSAASSLYQNCLSVRERLYRVPGFAERFLDDPSTPDPVSHVTAVFRLGASLCFLFNLMPVSRPLPVHSDCSPDNLKACKSSAAHFIMGCRAQGLWQNTDDGDGFTVTMLYEQDTNGTVKVINTMSRMLFALEQRGVLNLPQDLPAVEEASLGALDDRAKVVREILESERKYVQDLEVLQEYQSQLLKSDVITPDFSHHLFLNLNTLVDFQRRFLIGVEANASQPPSHQRFGLLFQQMEDNFSCYQPYCANYTAANDLAIQEADSLKSCTLLDPHYELPTFLIKPVQRICKYPLLLQQLVKVTDTESSHFAELQAGLDVIKAVTERVNETRRKQENEQAVSELINRVEDWKGHDVNTFGSLLLENVLMVIKNDNEREYHVYLFERIILCCKEASEPGRKKDRSKKDTTSKYGSVDRNSKPPPSKLHLKGRIFINNVLNAVPLNKNGSHLLQVTWRGDSGEESFSIKFKQEDQLKHWQKILTKAVEDSLAHRRSRPHFQPSSASSASSSRSRITSPLSQFPVTPLSELGSTSSYMSTDSTRRTNSAYSYHGADEHNNRHLSEESVHNNRNPTYTQSLPPNSRAMSSSSTASIPVPRPRAQTEDSYGGGAINQWRSQAAGSSTPFSQSPDPMPNLPPGARISDMRNSNSTSHRPKLAPVQSAFSDGRQTPLASASQSRSMTATTTSSSVPEPTPTMRSRSTPGAELNDNGFYPSGPTEDVHPNSNTKLPPRRRSGSSAGTDGSFSMVSSGKSRSQSSSTSPTETASDYFASNYFDDRIPPEAEATPVRIKVNYGEDTLTVVVLNNTGFSELVDKILKKIRFCGASANLLDERSLRLRYEDEEGDKILLSADDDVSMAFEWCRMASDGSVPPVLNLFVD